MATLARLVVEIAANTAKFNTEMARAQDQARRGAAGIQRALGGIQRDFVSLTSTVNRFASVLGVSLGIGGLAATARSVLAFADNLEEMSQRLGIGAEQLQVFQFAAKQTGLSVESMERGLRTLADSVGDAARGDTSAVKKFEDLGVSIEGTAGHVADFETIIGRVADRVAAATSPIEKINIASKAFGDRVGTQMIPMLEKGSAGFREWAKAAREAGVIVSTEMLTQAGKAKDMLDAMGTSIMANLVPALVALGPHLETAAKGITSLAVAIGQYFSSFVSPDKLGIDEINRQIQELEAESLRLRKELALSGPPSDFALGGWLTFQGHNARKGLAELQKNEQRMAELRAARDKLMGKPPVREPGLKIPGAGEPSVAVFEDILSKSERLRERALRLSEPEIDVTEGIIPDETVAKVTAMIPLLGLYNRQLEASAPKILSLGENQYSFNTILDGTQAIVRSTADAMQHYADATEEVDHDLRPISERQIAFDETTTKLRLSLEKITREAQVFGEGMSTLGERTTALRLSIIELLDAGFDPMSVEIQNLKRQLDTLATVDLAVGGVKDFFGSLDQALTQSIAGVIQGTQTIEQAFQKMGESIALSLIQNVIRRGIDQVQKAIIDMVVQLAAAGIKGAMGGGVGRGIGPVGSTVGPGIAPGGLRPYHSGGIAATPQLATLAEHGPEIVLPVAKLEGLLANTGESSVVINNYTDSRVQASQKQTPDGRQIQVLIDNAVQSGIANGRYDRAASSAWGVTRQPVPR